MSEQKVFRHRDFEFLIPEGWEFIEKESQPECIVFQSTKSESRVTISIMRITEKITSEETKTMLERVIAHRRKAEQDEKPNLILTPYKISQCDEFFYSKWGGRDSSEDKRTATLITIENSKVFTLYTEMFSTDDDHLSQTADMIADNFKAK